MVAIAALLTSFALIAPAVARGGGRGPGRGGNGGNLDLGLAPKEIPAECTNVCVSYVDTLQTCAEVECLCQQSVITGIAQCFLCAQKTVNTPTFNATIAKNTVNSLMGMCKNEGGITVTADGFPAYTAPVTSAPITETMTTETATSTGALASQTSSADAGLSQSLATMIMAAMIGFTLI